MQASFPYRAFYQATAPRLVGQSLDNQEGLSGALTAVPTLTARWELTATFVIYREAAELAWQAFVAQMEGRVGTTLVPIWSRFRPRDMDGRNVPWVQTPAFADAQTHEHWALDIVPAITASLAEAAAQRANTIKVVFGDTDGIRPGQFFSIGERLHRAQLVWIDGAGVTNVQFQPPLREAAAQGADVILDRVVCKMRAKSDTASEMNWNTTPAQFITVDFVEAI